MTHEKSNEERHDEKNGKEDAADDGQKDEKRNAENIHFGHAEKMMPELGNYGDEGGE